MLTKKEVFQGILLGTAVGDSLGLPMEGLTPSRQRRMFPGKLGQRLVLGRGLISDDTEHAFLVTQALLAGKDSVECFTRRLAWGLRFWFLILPAGVGLATARACLKLLVGVPATLSGVYSAGNGPAMRVAILGALFAHDERARNAFVRATTRITHTDPKALVGAQAIAEMVAWMVRDECQTRPPLSQVTALLRNLAPDDMEWMKILQCLELNLQQGRSTESFCQELGLQRGVTGYMYHTVPVVLHAWYRHWGDFAETVSAVIGCGGDTDTTGAIAGAMAGCVTGEAGIPAAWIDRIADWPRSISVLREAAGMLANLAGRVPAQPVTWCWPLLPLRNLVFLGVVLAHGFRRLLPPY